MTPQALKALKESIEHWERLATGQRKPGEIVGPDYCALCQQFQIGIPSDEKCLGCPVMESGVDQPFSRRYCMDTPWDRIENAMDDHGTEQETRDWLDTPEARVLAGAELEFLKSLLPEDGK